MGKYDHYNGTPSNDAIPTMLVVIANELAEANRLKRIKLLMSKDVWEDEKGNESHTFVSINDLEDKT